MRPRDLIIIVMDVIICGNCNVGCNAMTALNEMDNVGEADESCSDI